MIPHAERMVHNFGVFHLVTSEVDDGLEFHVPVSETEQFNLSAPKAGIIELAGVLLCWLSQNGMTVANREYFEAVARGVATWREQRAADPEGYRRRAELFEEAMGDDPGAFGGPAGGGSPA